ncbi:histidinol-phosphate transaminase [Sinorhizobium medicae]|uniref:Histidinol-phosphate aminotransferase n=1 Tax=Sinorhizobium medicae TaxID=110321 RepID=A0A508X5G9_9HYPH|nr:histidinol-phosphate transaminase [Sinorhizobium medicae]MBO1960268.1 histidinol-phosphate transaminase [Sinorhizobium medicae]MDX0424030.1 histidinol-phosphate transaminase [Sinorhizobium medicae]MDX0431461.1 histidinol-phosphate transaminase [Sinorhizobium medicae]MDX0435164.1 histidinol-phosphate transaminase [Sinorhizobium medicae]MDX0453599.1 histidinol-phosphate transaminase [Sinorhizobium medicae]
MADPSSPIREEIRSIAPYNAGLTLEEVRANHHVEKVAKLGSNENPLGPSPALRRQFPDIGELARLYPDPQGRALCTRLAASFDVGSDQVILGNGSEDLIAVICRSVVRPGDTVATLYPSFPLHEDYTALMGGKVDRVTVAPDLTVDTKTLLAAISRKPRMLMFSNPMNPVGSWLTPDQLAQLIAGLDPETLIVVDEAYAEYAAGDDYPSAAEMLKATGLNWVVLRTFSKAYGLAGLRIGYGIVSDGSLCGFFNRARTPFNTNAIAQAAALTALDDVGHLNRSVELAIVERERMKKELTTMGYRIAPSRCNFLFIDARTDASVLAGALLRQGVIVKPWKQPGFETYIRVSIGSPVENDHFIEAFQKVEAAG